MTDQTNKHYEPHDRVHADTPDHESKKPSPVVSAIKATGMGVLHITGAPVIYRRGKNIFKPHYPEVWAQLKREPLETFKRPVPMTKTTSLHIIGALLMVAIGFVGFMYGAFATVYLLGNSPLPSWVLGMNVAGLMIMTATCIGFVGIYGTISYRLITRLKLSHAPAQPTITPAPVGSKNP